jgi:hypothetical protein
MSRPIYAALAAAYPKRPKEGIPHSGVDQVALYESIGHPEFAHDLHMQNTCATRVSIALLAAGFTRRPATLPCKLVGLLGCASKLISRRCPTSCGDWDPQGHIDLVEATNMGDLQCAGSCYWSSTEVWFWPLK